jgi:hypothetical protein
MLNTYKFEILLLRVVEESEQLSHIPRLFCCHRLLSDLELNGELLGLPLQDASQHEQAVGGLFDGAGVDLQPSTAKFDRVW